MKENIRFKQLKNLFNNFYDTKKNGIWLSGIKGEGLFKKWYNNGVICIECNYKNGQLDGNYKEWYYNGKIKKDCNYKKGKIKGVYKKWNYNGKIIKEIKY